MSTEEISVVRSRQPKDSKFKQQALPAWQPILTAGTVLPTFFVIGVAFVPIGIGLLYFSDQVFELEVPYENCLDSSNQLCHEVIASREKQCTCVLPLTDDKLGTEDWKGTVFIYYGLTNFYQNHRRYVKSRDDSQLMGDLTSTPSKDCDPFLKESDDAVKYYAPCGAIANSLFNDTITLQYRKTGGDWKDVTVNRTGIAWTSDKQYKFKNPTVPAGKTLQQVFSEKTIKPRDWSKEIWELDTEIPDNNGFQNEDLIVWMRTAALPNFRKLYRRVEHSGEFTAGLPVQGYEYQLVIEYNYRVKEFKGTKSVILSTTSLLGGKNPFLGIAYIVVGAICFVIGIVFLFIHLKYGRTTQEMMNISQGSSH